MKKKIVILGAVLAAFLMLATPCMARPLQEKTNMDASKNAQQGIVDSIEAMFLKTEYDQEFKRLIEQMSAGNLDHNDWLTQKEGEKELSIVPAGLIIRLLIQIFQEIFRIVGELFVYLLPQIQETIRYWLFQIAGICLILVLIVIKIVCNIIAIILSPFILLIMFLEAVLEALKDTGVIP